MLRKKIKEGQEELFSVILECCEQLIDRTKCNISTIVNLVCSVFNFII